MVFIVLVSLNAYHLSKLKDTVFCLASIDKRQYWRSHDAIEINTSSHSCLSMNSTIKPKLIPNTIIKPKFKLSTKTQTQTHPKLYNQTQTQIHQAVWVMRSPLAKHLSAVQTLLNYLEKVQVITSELRKKISPKLNRLELVYYHGLPKLHKVN